MSLFQVVPKLRNEKIPIELLSWYLWKQSDKMAIPAVKEESEEEQQDNGGPSPSQKAPAVAVKGEMRYDSCGIFTLQRQKKMRMWTTRMKFKVCQELLARSLYLTILQFSLVATGVLAHFRSSAACLIVDE